jgi:predicted membrane protein
MSRDFQRYKRDHHCRPHRKGDKAILGIIIILVGVVIMLKKMHMFYFDWQLLWPIAMIAVGLMVGIRRRFHNHAWWILILIGAAHLIPEFDINGTSSASLIAPFALIIGGLMIIFRSRKKKEYFSYTETTTSNENVLNIDVTFAGRKEIITSKDFRGGGISATFGGVEVNMMQADSTTQPMILNVKVSFGGIELIVPSHWEIQNEIDTTAGSVEDHRAIRTNASSVEDKKVLILRGNCSFGSVEIKSY